MTCGDSRGFRLQSLGWILLSLLWAMPAASQLLSGYSLTATELMGPTRRAIATDPIWVADYPTLVVDYTATGAVNAKAAVLTLRPGSIGPITPRATNPENPLASGEDIVAVRGEDLVFDGKPHTLKVDLTSRIKTPQIDMLRFEVPGGAKLNIGKLEFVGAPELLPCAASERAAMPADTRTLMVHGELSCDGAVATSLRGKESLKIDVAGKRGTTLYLDLLVHLAGFTNYVASQPSRPAATSETSLVIANVRYADHPAGVEQQFPLLVSEHRHTLLNQKRALYALQLDPSRQLLSVELVDRSPHVQLVLFRAALSNRGEQSADEAAPAASRLAMNPQCNVASVLGGSEWFHVSGGSDAAAKWVKASLVKTPSANGVELGLALTNTSDQDIDVALAFPALNIHVSSDPRDVQVLFPQKVATISSEDATLTAEYGPNFLLQFTDVSAAGAGCGAVVIVKDTTGQSKTFAVTKSKDLVSDKTEYRVRIAPHQTYTAPAATVILHNGDWHSGFDAYKQWLRTWYEPHTPHPDWLADSFFMRRDYPLGGSGLLFDDADNRYTFPRLIEEGKALGGIDFIDISGWALSDTHGRVGDYPIELGGMEDLRNNIEGAKREHVSTGLYFEGYLIDKNSDVGRENGAKWQLIGADGKGLWWPHDSPELFVCPHVSAWQSYLSNRIAEVAKQTGAGAVYLDEFGCRNRQCFAADHGHPVGANVIGGEIAMAKQVRKALDDTGLKSTIVYTECPPVDVGAPYVDGSFTYALPSSTAAAYGVKLNLWRFAFPKVRLWDMLSSGVEPHILSAEDFRMSFWQGDGIWLKGRSDTWYGQDILEFLRWAHPLLLKHAAAFAGEAEPFVSSPDPHILVNRFRGGGETVFTLFNNTYETRRIKFHNRSLTFEPRGVQLVAEIGDKASPQ